MDETRGFMKAVVDSDTQRILGCAILGIGGGEVATMIQIAMMGDLPYTALRDGVFSHPTLSSTLYKILFVRFVFTRENGLWSICSEYFLHVGLKLRCSKSIPVS